MGIRMTVLLALVPLTIHPAALKPADFPVYPLPQEIKLTGGRLDLAQAGITFFNGPDCAMAGLASYLSQEIAARHKVSILWQKAGETGGKKPWIILGLLSDPEITQRLAESGLEPDSRWEALEAYRLMVTPDQAVIAGHDLKGLFYGIQSFIDSVESPEAWPGICKRSANQ